MEESEITSDATYKAKLKAIDELIKEIKEKEEHNLKLRRNELEKRTIDHLPETTV